MAEESTRSNNIVLSYYDCLIQTEDVELLKGPHWLNDVLIGFYFEYLGEKHKKDDKQEILFISPEVTQLLKMTDPSEYSIFFDPINASDRSFIFLPLNNCSRKDSAGGSHWSLLVFSRPEKTCYHFDSLKGFNRATASQFAKNIMQYFCGKDNHKFIEFDCPEQENGYDCGVYVLCLTDIICEHALKENKISGCDCTQVKKLAKSKRSELLDLIEELRNSSNVFA